MTQDFCTGLHIIQSTSLRTHLWITCTHLLCFHCSWARWNVSSVNIQHSSGWGLLFNFLEARSQQPCSFLTRSHHSREEPPHLSINAAVSFIWQCLQQKTYPCSSNIHFKYQEQMYFPGILVNNSIYLIIFQSYTCLQTYRAGKVRVWKCQEKRHHVQRLIKKPWIRTFNFLRLGSSVLQKNCSLIAYIIVFLSHKL